MVHVTNNQFVFLAKDITQRKLADLELQQTRDNLQLLVEQKTKQLQEAMEVKSRFLAIMSHGKPIIDFFVAVVTYHRDKNST